MAVSYIAKDDGCQEEPLKRALPRTQVHIASTKRSSQAVKADAGIGRLALSVANVLSLVRALVHLLDAV